MGRHKKIKDETVKVKRAYRRKVKVAMPETKVVEDDGSSPASDKFPGKVSGCLQCSHNTSEHYGTVDRQCNHAGCDCPKYK